MNDKEERELIRTAKNKAVSVVVGAVLLGALTITIFYFTATKTLAQHGKSIEDLEIEVKKVTTVPVLNQNKIENVENNLRQLKEDQAEFQKETKASIDDLRKQNLKMLELLYEIKKLNRN